MAWLPSLDGSGALSSVAGIWSWSRSPNSILEHGYGSPEQVLGVLNPSKKALDLATQSHRAIKVICLAGTKQSSSKGKWSNFDAQITELGTLQLRNLSKIPQEARMHDGPISDQTIEDGHIPPRFASSKQASVGQHTSAHQQSVEGHLDEGRSVASCVLYSHPSHVHVENNVDDVLRDNAPIWNEPFLGIQRAHAGVKKSREPPVDTSKQVVGQKHSPVSEPSRFDEADFFQGSNIGFSELRNAGMVNDSESSNHSCNGAEYVNKEFHYARDKQLADDFTPYKQGIKAASPYLDAQMARSVHGMKGTLSPVDKLGVRVEYQTRGDDAWKLSAVGMDAKESMNTSVSSSKIAAVRMPAYRAPTYLQDSFSDTVFYLESLGVDCSRVFRDEPTLKSRTVKQIKALVSALEQYGLKWSDSGRVFNLSPKILLMNPERDLKVVTSFLFNEAGLLPGDFRKVIRRCPRLLVSDINKQLRPTLSFLRSLGYAKMGHAISNNPCLLSYDVETRLIPRLRFLESWGFTYREAAALVVRFPAIFNYSTNDNLQCKYDYLVHEIGGSKKDLLAFPQYFGYSLDTKIRPRHQCIAKLNVSLSIQAMLTLSEAEFNAKFSSVNGGKHSMQREVGPSLYESIEAKLHDCNRESLKFPSLENPETRVLVSV